MITEKYEDTYESQDVKCPYCGVFISDSWELDINDDTIECECDCGKKFWVGKSIIINYTGTADCELNKEKHEFVKNFENLKCKICGKFKLK